MSDRAVMERYRVFRAECLQHVMREASRERWAGQGAATSEHRFARGRRAVAAFRQRVAARVDELLAASPLDAALVRRALRLDATVSLRPSAWSIAGQVAWFFLPTPWVGHRARHLLARAGSFEGRRLLFEHFISRTLPGRGLYYDEGLDFALSRFEAIRSWEDLDGLQRRDIHLLRLALQLGVRRPGELREAFPYDSSRHSSELLLVLAGEGAIRTTQELLWAGRPSRWLYGAPLDADELQELRSTVRCMLAHGLARQQVAGISRYPLSTMDTRQLRDNLGYLAATGVDDLSELLERVGDRLWRSPTGTWRYVVETMGATSAPAIARFARLLDCREALPEELAQELRALGADQEGLVRCQGLLAGLRSGQADLAQALAGLRTLAAPPHGLSVEELAQCLDYLRAAAGLAPFLQVLTTHGFDDAPTVLAFQCCFGKVAPTALDRLLSILGPRAQDQPLEHITSWILAAAAGGHFDAYDYLVGACGMADLAALRQALKLVPLGEPFLRHLVEVRQLRSLAVIRDWYYGVRGIDRYRSARPYDAVDRVLLDDAFARNQFNHVDGNLGVIAAFVHQRTQQELGPMPWPADDAQRQTYWRASSALAPTIRAQLLPALPRILASTGGVLLPSLLDVHEENGDGLQRRLARLTPLLDDLLAGGGPCEPELSPLEAEAVSLVYRTPVQTVQSRWAQVVGHAYHLQRLQLRSQYTMAWRSVRWQLRSALDRSGFTPLLTATKFSQGFRPGANGDMFSACRGLSPKQLRPSVASSDLSTVALHLGSLLAVAAEHEGVGSWMRGGFEDLSRMDEDSLEAYQRISALVDLFAVVLPDALDAHTSTCIERMPDQDAAHWASRLGPAPEGVSGREQLRVMLLRTRAKVLPLYLGWAQCQLRRYKKTGRASSAEQALVARVSKAPTAFFAKSAVQLCTADNVAMWREERLSHLVVFDPDGRRLAGMALLYVQPIAELDRTRSSLVIRAINPTDEMLGGHDPESIVDSFLQVAVQIARDNRLACVAIPAPSGMHLMSNRASIEAYVKDRYVRRARPHLVRDADGRGQSLQDCPSVVRARFFAYEEGCELVEELYVVWRPEAIAPMPGSVRSPVWSQEPAHEPGL
jgi:hypothetical protein